ncbi:hypothetical protein DAD99_21170 [Pseudarthrobacter sp. AB1]|nr:hypothetical protein [Pseudarthrobacter sp. AB1]
MEAWVEGKLPLMNGWGRKPTTVVDAAVRIDLRELGGQFDAVSAVIAIRRELGTLKKQWPAFDFAFAAYWEAAHPGEPFPSQGKADNGFAEAVGETVENVFGDLDVLGTVVGVGSRSARAAIRELKRRKIRRVAFESFDGYRDLLERCSDLPTPTEPRPDLVIDLAMLLAMELSTHWTTEAPLVVVFLDTVERLAQDPRRIGERRLNKLVWSMPNVLFVMTGRNLIDWYDRARSNLFAVGPSVWPGLRPGSTTDPRQHLVGKLSTSDTRKVIDLGRKKYGVSISGKVVEELVVASGGLPQYLDLALVVALNVKANGSREVTVADVTGSLNDLVLRVLEDVPEDEQRAIRAASMFLFFDVGLIAAAANVDYGTAERAVRRPMIDFKEGASYPYRMHDEIRSAIRWSDHRIAGGWAGQDWYEAGTRALREARRRVEGAEGESSGVGGLAALGLAIGIVCEQELKVEASASNNYRDWLTEAIVHGPSVAGLRTYVPATSRTAYGQKVLEFISAKSYDVHADERRALLRNIFDSGHPLAFPAGRHLAYQFRNENLWADSISTFEELIELSPTELNRYQRLLTIANARRFMDASAGLEDLSSRRESLQANLELLHGRPELWLNRVNCVLERITREGRQRDGLEHEGAALRWRTILVGDVDLPEIAKLMNKAEGVGYETAVRECLTSTALLAPGSHGEDPFVMQRLEELDKRANEGRIGFRTATVRALRGFVSEDMRVLHEVRNELEQRPERGMTWVPVECLLDSVGLPVRCPDTQWIEPYQVVQNRWAALFSAYRSRVEQR